jgi:hypothetical protein
MRLGICTRWQRRDVTYAAIQLADLFSRWGHSVSILTITSSPALVSHYWDRKVLSGRNARFTDWASALDVVLWTSCPHRGQVVWTNKAGKQTVLLADPADGDRITHVYPDFSQVLAPSRYAARMLAVAGLRNVIPCAWSPVLPPTRKDRRDTELRVYVPPAAGNDALAVIEALLGNYRFTASVSADGHCPAALRRFRRLAREYRDRLTILPREDYDRQLASYAEHDLTLLAVGQTALGMEALCSIHMGTPVLAYRVHPLDEIVGGHAGDLVDRISENDALQLARRLALYVTEPERIDPAFNGCPDGLTDRREAFEIGLTMIAERPVGFGGRIP